MWDFLEYFSRVLALSGCFYNFSCFESRVWVLFKNIFMNCVKKLLVKRGTKEGKEVFRKVEALVKVLLLPILDFLTRS